MKKILSFLICLVLAISLLPQTVIFANAATTGTSGNLKYTAWTNTATITGCNTSASGAVVIPETINGYQVVEIGEYAFSGCSKITSITIPPSVRVIENLAFNNCSGIKEVHISDIGAWCNITFWGANSNPVEICGNLYLNGKLATDVVIPEGITEISENAFRKCTSLASVTIPDGVTSIGGNAFYGCKSLESVTVPDSVEYIGWSAFDGCIKLKSVSIPAGVKYIKSSTFNDCTSLTNIVIPEGVRTIEASAFEDCTNLVNVTIPGSVKSIDRKAFYNCKSLTSVTLPSCVTLDDSVFANCKSLTSFVHPNGVKLNDISAFNGCKSLTGTITIADGVTSIPLGTFVGCEKLTGVIIPDSVTSIDSSAFYRCTSLTEVTIPDSVTSIGNSAFYGCTSLTEAAIPDSVTSIGGSAFHSCTGLKKVSIPYSVTSIGDKYVFYNCASLENIDVDETNEKYRSIDGVLFDKVQMELMCYPAAKAADSYVIPNGITSISASAFYRCKSLTEVTIPDSVTSIGNSAFYGCTSLEKVYYSGSKDDWGKISISSSNTPLTNAEIICNFGTKVMADMGNSVCTYSSGKASVAVEMDVLLQDATVLAAIYDSDGKLVAVDSVSVKKGERDAELEFVADEKWRGYTVKTMVWSQDESAKPLGKSAETTIE